MAVRIHVTASMGNQEAIRATFRELLGESFDNIPIEATPPWNFFTTSVWGVGGAKLVDGLRRIGHTGLQATTSDASRWVLTLIHPDQPPQSFLHEFNLFRSPWDPEQTAEPPEPDEIDPRLAFLEPDPEPGTQRQWSQFDSIADDYASMGAPIDESFRDRVQGMTYGAALNEFQRYETARLADCLAEAGLEFDRQELLEALLWKSTTEREYDADIGNLPRVLLALGLRGSIANFFNSVQDEDACEGAQSVDDDVFDDDESDDEFDEDSDEDSDEDESGGFAMESLFDGDGDEDEDEEISEEDQREIEEIEAKIHEMQRQANRSRRRKRRATSRDSGDAQWGEDTFLSITRDAASIHPLTPISGGGVAVCIQKLSLLYFFSHAVSAGGYPPAVITTTPPPEVKAAEMLVSNPNCSDIEVRPGDGAWLVGARSLNTLESSDWKSGEGGDFLVSYLGQELTNLLRQPPDGTRLQVDFADVAQPDVCLRFAGSVRNGKWRITESFPQLDQQTFEEALSLARQQEADEYELSSNEEAEAILEAAGRDGYLHNMGVTRHENRVRCEHDGMGFVARLILRHRFGHTWNFAPALKQIDEEWQKRRTMEQQMRRQAAAMRRDRSPHCDRQQVIYRGDVSVYWKADMAAWSVLEPETREKFDESMNELGFTCLGDFVCKKVRDYVQRVFISPDQRSYALLLAGSFGYISKEYVSHFENDAHLTTSTSWLAQSHPEIEVYAQHCPELTTEALYERHCWGIGRFHSHKQTVAIELEPSLAGLCCMFDKMLERMSTVESSLISFETIDLSDSEN
ncbi:MAG TPA: hypothetical protein PKA83_19270 [Pirellulaceae bacterium]|nr:hypothetical protein [Pirellulaceae bacterium]